MHINKAINASLFLSGFQVLLTRENDTEEDLSFQYVYTFIHAHKDWQKRRRRLLPAIFSSLHRSYTQPKDLYMYTYINTNITEKNHFELISETKKSRISVPLLFFHVLRSVDDYIYIYIHLQRERERVSMIYHLSGIERRWQGSEEELRHIF